MNRILVRVFSIQPVGREAATKTVVPVTHQGYRSGWYIRWHHSTGGVHDAK